MLAKLAEVKPNVRLWYRDEGQFQQALQAGEIPMGQYYHDVTGLAAAEGQPVRSTFPEEGGVLDFGLLVRVQGLAGPGRRRRCSSTTCAGPRSRPSCRARSARRRPSSATCSTSRDEEFAAVASDIPPIIPRYDLYAERDDWLDQKWTEMIAG